MMMQIIQLVVLVFLIGDACGAQAEKLFAIKTVILEKQKIVIDTKEQEHTFPAGSLVKTIFIQGITPEEGVEVIYGREDRYLKGVVPRQIFCRDVDGGTCYCVSVDAPFRCIETRWLYGLRTGLDKPAPCVAVAVREEFTRGFVGNPTLLGLSLYFTYKSEDLGLPFKDRRLNLERFTFKDNPKKLTAARLILALESFKIALQLAGVKEVTDFPCELGDSFQDIAKSKAIVDFFQSEGVSTKGSKNPNEVLFSLCCSKEFFEVQEKLNELFPPSDTTGRDDRNDPALDPEKCSIL